MNWILLSHILKPGIPSYGNRDKLIIEHPSSLAYGNTANSSSWNFTSNHLGTHIDVPNHFFDEGMTISDYPASFWFSEKILLIDIPLEKSELITPYHLNDKVKSNIEVLLVRTGFEKYRHQEKYWNDNPGVAAETGFWLRKNFPEIKIFGFDFISLTSWKFRDEGKKAHKAFLDPIATGKPVCLIEDMSLKSVQNTVKQIIVAPLLVEKGNGSPVTVLCN
ncbi:MAG: cyclase family protein [Lentimicrobiaceae bacterium]|jgi:kynurenine formamidase|nr:cyclase family protein [Lentimicrobiaceae bacterium]